MPGCDTSEDAPGTDEPAVLRVMMLPHLTFAPLLIAQEEGFFAAEGLDVRFYRLGTPASTVPLLLQGKLDVLPTPASPALLNAIGRGSPVRFVADKGHLPASRSCSHMSIVVRRELLKPEGSGETPSDGASHAPSIRRLSTSREALFRFLVTKAFESRGLSLEQVERIYLPAAAELDALRDGAVDAAFISDPWKSRLVEGGDGAVWVELEDVVPDMQYSLIVYGQKLLEEEPELGRRFMVAYVRGIRQLNQGKTERNLEVLEAATGFDREELRRLCWPSFRDDGRINAESVIDFQRWLVNRGLIDVSVPEQQFWEPSFTEYANQALEE
jgi:NitT/TauT family transport system substrate-binding protein